MSWALSSKREFSLESHSTPKPVGPGKYDVSREIGNSKPMKAPFNVRAGPPIDHLSGIPGPGQYEAKPVDESQCDYASVFNSRTKRSLYGKFPPYPAPDRYSEIKDWTPAPPPEPRPNYEPEPYRPPSGFFGQPNIAGYAENEVVTEAALCAVRSTGNLSNYRDTYTGLRARGRRPHGQLLRM